MFQNRGPLMTPYGHKNSGHSHFKDHFDAATKRPPPLPSSPNIVATEKMEDATQFLINKNITGKNSLTVQASIASCYKEKMLELIKGLDNALEAKSSELLIGSDDIMAQVKGHVNWMNPKNDLSKKNQSELTMQDASDILTNNCAGEESYASLRNHLQALKSTQVLTNGRNLSAIKSIVSQINAIIEFVDPMKHPGDKVIEDINRHYQPNPILKVGHFFGKAACHLIGMRPPLKWRSWDTIRRLSLAAHFPVKDAKGNVMQFGNINEVYEAQFPIDYQKTIKASVLSLSLGFGPLPALCVGGLYSFVEYQNFKKSFYRE